MTTCKKKQSMTRCCKDNYRAELMDLIITLGLGQENSSPLRTQLVYFAMGQPA